MKNAAFLITLIIAIFISGFLLIQKIGKLNANPYLTQIGQAFKTISNYLESSATKTPTPKVQSPLATTEPIPQTTMKSLPKPTTKATSKSRSTVIINGKTIYDSNFNPQPTTSNLNEVKSSSAGQITCYRFTAPHLDGSSSNLCYSQADYNQLIPLLSQYNSAKANYEFELRVAQMYADSDHFRYLSDEAKRKAQEWKDKMGEIALKMYNVESRGW